MKSKTSPRIFLSPPHMSGEEMTFIQEAFTSNYIAPLGPMVDAFEREFAAYTGIPYCLALSSGTAAMHLALRELGVGQGDIVLASSLTFIGSVSSATFLGAKITFIDSDRATWNMDTELLAAELADCAKRGKLPKAVIPTDLYGQCADLDQIKALCAPHNIPVIVDSAESAGATYKGHSAGYGAKASIYSFNGNKIITTSGGGMLASEDQSLIEHARKLSQQARDPELHYEHTEIGYNYRLSNVLAAIGRGQLSVLDQRVARKRDIFVRYQQLLADLPGIDFMPEAPYGRSNRWLTVILVTEKEFGASWLDIARALATENIEARPVWKPMHLQPVFKGCGYRGSGVSNDLFSRGLCLPSGTALMDSDLDRIAGIIRSCRK